MEALLYKINKFMDAAPTPQSTSSTYPQVINSITMHGKGQNCTLDYLIKFKYMMALTYER